MSKPNNRTGAANFNGLPVVDDARLVALVLTLPIGATLRAELTELQLSIEPGRFGALKRATRDRLMKLAVDSGAMRRIAPAAKKGIHISLSCGYEERIVKGTDVAERLLYDDTGKPRPIPVPPHRIAAALKAKSAQSDRRSA